MKKNRTTTRLFGLTGALGRYVSHLSSKSSSRLGNFIRCTTPRRISNYSGNVIDSECIYGRVDEAIATKRLNLFGISLILSEAVAIK